MAKLLVERRINESSKRSGSTQANIVGSMGQEARRPTPAYNALDEDRHRPRVSVHNRHGPECNECLPTVSAYMPKYSNSIVSRVSTSGIASAVRADSTRAYLRRREALGPNKRWMLGADIFTNRVKERV